MFNLLLNDYDYYHNSSDKGRNNILQYIKHTNNQTAESEANLARLGAPELVAMSVMMLYNDSMGQKYGMTV